MSLKVLIVFPNFRLICSYFVLVTIIIFDLALHISIFIIHVEYFWLLMTGLKERFHTLILNFVYITFCLLTEPQTVTAGDFIVKFLLSFCAFCSFIAHLCAKFQLTWYILTLEVFCVLASSLVIVLKFFLIFG